MIARILYPLLFAIFLTELYFDQLYVRRHPHAPWWKRAARWLPALVMGAYTVYMGTTRNFVPDNMAQTTTYVMLLGFTVIPRTLSAPFSALGVAWRKLGRHRRNRDGLVALIIFLACACATVYGFTIGFSKLEVKHIDIYSADLPEAFDGYRIVHFSDAHVGSFTGWRKRLLQRDIDSINAQQADLIAFTGDLQNMQPKELLPVESIMRSLSARDGVVSVLGNHDYAEYIDAPAAVEAANCRETIDRQRQWGWQVLLNGNTTLRRGTDSLVIAGEQNLVKPDSANFNKTMQGVMPGTYVVMLQHNPDAWDLHIKGSHRVQLTLSGHVHAGQLSIFGMRPTQLKYKEDYGLFHEDGKWLYVTSGIGTLLPFRIGASAEIAVITLHKSKR